ncbi:hypothetical protein BT96DRAFT_522616 [Gymnopus androsaceus JB14]|uniref:F-box domain-containing protein n=1 Tax=Gymnopus androsaceus JB14 TaxID=1447944 RepID=A0A6A4HXB0_9AGAR|nr:hypothetical protein BT96DRAFT_522616 [Gymnopus androsaceus JB14]
MYINVEKMNHLIINSPASSWISLPGQKLMSVCARWREIAKSCKDLWTHIFLGLYSVANADTNRRITAALQWCMDHAGPTAPLDIMLEWYLSDDTEKSVFCELLYSQASRWRNLTITSESIDLATLFPSLFEGEAPNFPLLEVIHSDGCLNLGRFHKAQKLHELSLSYPPDMDADGPVFPWTQIKTLNLDCRHQDVVSVSPSIFPELESLSYNFLSVSFEIPDFPPHTLDALRSFSFTSTYGLARALENLLEPACYPALERMVIDLSPYKFRRYNVPAVVGLDLEEMVWPDAK